MSVSRMLKRAWTVALPMVALAVPQVFAQDVDAHADPGEVSHV
ncbi:MAG TPA: hypothetical protein VI566_01540 [Xanthomonadales bacterium]|nr:hypothetical protein [Xanthomonadales bacterium]